MNRSRSENTSVDVLMHLLNKEKNSLDIKIKNENEILVNDTNTHNFNHCWGDDKFQKGVYNYYEAVVDNLITDSNIAIISIRNQGTHDINLYHSKSDDKGLIMTILASILSKTEDFQSWNVKMSMLEILGEDVIDVYSSETNRRRIKSKEDLVFKEVRNSNEGYFWYQYGVSHHTKEEAKKLVSISHYITQIFIQAKSFANKSINHCISFIDIYTNESGNERNYIFEHLKSIILNNNGYIFKNLYIQSMFNSIFKPEYKKYFIFSILLKDELLTINYEMIKFASMCSKYKTEKEKNEIINYQSENLKLRSDIRELISEYEEYNSQILAVKNKTMLHKKKSEKKISDLSKKIENKYQRQAKDDSELVRNKKDILRRLDKAKEKLNEAEKENEILNEYKMKYLELESTKSSIDGNIKSLEIENRNLIKSFHSIDSQLREANSQFSVLNRKYRQLQKNCDDSFKRQSYISSRSPSFSPAISNRSSLSIRNKSISVNLEPKTDEFSSSLEKDKFSFSSEFPSTSNKMNASQSRIPSITNRFSYYKK